tara:strand:- start:3261 stop:3692 length:432 start_codon:yes stop_codon:yes gene_type:complete
MGIIEKSKILRANATLTYRNAGKDIKDVQLIDLPDKWQPFNGGEWVNLPMPEDLGMTALLFKGKSGKTFGQHIHSVSVERMGILNEGGKMKVYIEDTGIFNIEYPQSIVIPKGKRHDVDFITDCTIQVIWKPGLGLFDGEFAE